MYGCMDAGLLGGAVEGRDVHLEVSSDEELARHFGGCGCGCGLEVGSRGERESVCVCKLKRKGREEAEDKYKKRRKWKWKWECLPFTGRNRAGHNIIDVTPFCVCSPCPYSVALVTAVCSAAVTSALNRSLTNIHSTCSLRLFLLSSPRRQRCQ